MENGAIASERPATLPIDPDLHGTGRLGVAQVLRFAFEGNDLAPLQSALYASLPEPGAGMDCAVLEQVLGSGDLGLQLQRDALKRQRLYRSPGSAPSPRLRVLALAVPLDVGSNCPVDFLVNRPDIELTTLYILPDRPIEVPLPEHDVAIVVMTAGDGTVMSLERVATVAAVWPRPLLNDPQAIVRTERDQLFQVLAGIEGLVVPPTARLSRQGLVDLATGNLHGQADLRFPLVVRPVDSHAGRGLERLDDGKSVARYLAETPSEVFFVMGFVDFSSGDGLFRKYRVTFVDGRAFACHMAIAEQWKIWYLNAGMATDAHKRAEEAHFFENFDTGFAHRHAVALEMLAARIGLEYFSIDCAELPNGDLLVFEAGVAMVVHDMDLPDLYPYKPAQMARIFAAFQNMLGERARI